MFTGYLIAAAIFGVFVWRIVDRIKNASRARDDGPEF